MSQLFIRTLTGKNFQFDDLDFDTVTIGDLKRQIEARDAAYPADRLVVLLQGSKLLRLGNELTPADIGLLSEATLMAHMPPEDGRPDMVSRAPEFAAHNKLTYTPEELTEAPRKLQAEAPADLAAADDDDV